MADPQTADQGFLAGLLGKFGSNPAAEYGGLLSDPATQRQFALRSLGAAAQAMAQASMPVPYKGGTPWGSFLGSAGGAAATAGDELIKARLEQAQTDLAQQQGLLAHANVQGLAMNNSLYPVALGLDVKGGTGTDGKPLTGPAAIIAGKGGKAISSTTADTSLPPEARALLDTIAGPESNGAYNVRWGGPSGDKTFDSYAAHPNIPEPGPQGDSTAAGRYQIVNSTWKPLQAKYGFSDFTPVTQDQAGWHLAADTYKEQTGRDLLTDLQAGKTDQVASALHGQWSTLNMGSYGKNLGKYQGGSGASPQTASTGDQPAAAPGSQVGPYAPVPGQPPPQGVYVPPGASPNAPPVRIEGGPPPAAPAAPPTAPPAASRGLLDTSQGPLGSSAAPPQLAIPPAAGAPGPVTGLLGQQPAQQVAAADAPQLSPAAAAVLQGINRQQAGGGLLASGSVAGGNAVPTGGPSPAAVAQAGPPHTGAAGAAELAGLLAQQPPPQAPAAGPVPPAAAPAPAPAPAGPMPPAPGGAPPPGVAPPMPPPAMPPMPPQPVAPAAAPGPIPGAPTDRQIAAASIIAHNNIMMGKAVPPDIAAILNYKYAGPTAAAAATATAPITQANAAYEARVKAQYEDWVNQNKPREIRAGGVSVEPGTNRVIQNPAIVQTTNPQDGSEHSWYSYPSLTPGGIPTYQYIGMSKPGPGATSKLTETGRIQAEQEPQPPPQQPAPPLGTPPKPTYQGYQLAPGMMSKEPDYQEPQLNKTQIDAGYAAENWPKTTRELTSSIGAAQSAEQRLTTMATAFQQVGTGAFMSDKAAWNNTLDGVFGPGGGPAWLRTSTDAGAVMTAMHEAMRATLSNLKATNPNFANAEFQGLSKMSENPDLPISANLNMLAEDIGQLRQQQGLANGWIEARANGKQDPDLFRTKWLAQNKLPPIVEGVKKELGVGQMAPSGSQQQGGQSTPAQPLRAKEGDTVLGPDGSEYIIHNGVPIHKQTLQPYQSPGGR